MAKTRDELREYFMTTLKKIAPEMDPERLKPDKNLRRQAKIDSLDFQKLILLVKEDTGFAVPESDYRQLSTFNALLDYFEGRI